jgi:hypothetical protein
MRLEKRLRASDLFDNLGREDKIQDRKLDLTPNKEVGFLLTQFESYLAKVDPDKDSDEINEMTENYLGKRSFSSKDIAQFCLYLGKYQDNTNFGTLAGAYINHRIKHSLNKKFDIVTRHLEEKLEVIGDNNNGKIIQIFGDVGHFIGNFSNKGKIVISGNVGTYAGEAMHGGKLIVAGNADDFLGTSMYGGEIVVNGNAGNNIGREMSGGIIRLNGDFASLGKLMEGGDIYHRGKLIVKDGKVVK